MILAAAGHAVLVTLIGSMQVSHLLQVVINALASLPVMRPLQLQPKHLLLLQLQALQQAMTLEDVGLAHLVTRIGSMLVKHQHQVVIVVHAFHHQAAEQQQKHLHQQQQQQLKHQLQQATIPVAAGHVHQVTRIGSMPVCHLLQVVTIALVLLQVVVEVHLHLLQVHLHLRQLPVLDILVK